MIIKPYQIEELATTYGGSTTLSGLSALVLTGRTFTCPKCAGTGKIAPPNLNTGVPVPITIECDVCDGYGKTAVEFTAVCDDPRYIPVDDTGGGE